MSKTAARLGSEPVTRARESSSPPKNGKVQSVSPLKRLKPSPDTAAPSDAASNAAHGNADDAEVARRLHEQLNGPESPTNAPLLRHVTRQRKAPAFYKPEQFGGYGGYHSADSSQQDQAEANGDVSPAVGKQPQMSRELRRLFESSLNIPDSGKPSGLGRPRGSSSLPDGKQDHEHQPTKRSQVKAEADADTHSQSKGPARRKQRSATPEKGELRLTRSMQPKDTQPHLASEQQRPGNSLPAKLEQQGSKDRPAANQGSSGSPGKEATSGKLQRQRNGKAVNEDTQKNAKAEALSSRLSSDDQAASNSGASHMNGATAGQEHADASDAGAEGSDSGGGKISKTAKLPAKNPMVRQKSGGYYRVRVLKEESTRVRIEFMGFEQQLEPIWLSRASERIWRGSYKNKAWKHLGDGAWAPKSGEKNTPAVAHGTHQNQYTKRKALLNIANLKADSQDSKDDSGSDAVISDEEEDEGQEQAQQQDQSADTGFVAQSQDSGRAGLLGKGSSRALKEGQLGQRDSAGKGSDRPASSQADLQRPRDKDKAAASAVVDDNQEPAEPVASNKQHPASAKPQRPSKAGRKASSGPLNGHSKDSPVSKRRQSGPKGRVVENAEHSSSEATPMDTAEVEPPKAPGVSEAAQAAGARNQGPAKQAVDPMQRGDGTPVKAADEAPISSSDKNGAAHSSADDAHAPQDKSAEVDPPVNGTSTSSGHTRASGKAKSGSGGRPSPISKAQAESTAAAAAAAPDDVNAESDKAQKAASGRAAKADSRQARRAGAVAQGQQAGPGSKESQAVLGLEAALQCEENLAEDTSASPGNAVAGPAGGSDDVRAQAAPEADSPSKPISKPRRDRKGRIRGTYGINAKPAEPDPSADPPSDALPSPGVTRASLRPKPAAKANPDDDPPEAAQGHPPPLGLRHTRAHASGASEAAEAPSSPLPAPSSPPEAPRPDRKAFQRRAAAANNAVAAAMAAEAADISPPADLSSRALSKSHSQNGRRRAGSDTTGRPRNGLDGVRSGYISKAHSLGGSSGGGSSLGQGGAFGSLLQALGEYEAREGALANRLHQSYSNATAAPRAMPSSNGQTHSPALFDGLSNGLVSRWHTPLGPGSPSILTLSSDVFLPSSKSSQYNDGYGSFSYMQPQIPLFKPRDFAG